MATKKVKETKSKESRSFESGIISILESRFAAFPLRHKGISWEQVTARLEKRPEKIKILTRMEDTGGEPDVVGIDPKTKELIFMDCSPESPAGRRSVCFDQAAWKSRKENKPKSSAEALALEIGIELLTEEQYRGLQKLGSFDAKTSSWVQTPESIRRLGGALFCDLRYEQVFTYHNGAESYYAARGFRGILRV